MTTSSISQCKGKGSIGHNNREFYTDNIDRSRTSDNVVFINQPIGEAYKELFDGAKQRYNNKQKRPCRRIEEDYYDNLFNRPPCNQVVESTCKRKSFYEDLVQVGDKDTCGCGTPNGKLAEKCLTEYMEGFHQRNPNFHVFNAVMHVDEATPHLHINYIPVGHYKRGMDTQNGYNQALKEMGFTGQDCFRDWRERERAVLREICLAYGLEMKEPDEEKGRGHSFTVTEYKERQDKINEYEEQIKQLETEIKDKKTELEKIEGRLLSAHGVKNIKTSKTLGGKIKMEERDFISMERTAQKSQERGRELKKLKSQLDDTLSELETAQESIKQTAYLLKRNPELKKKYDEAYADAKQFDFGERKIAKNWAERISSARKSMEEREKNERFGGRNEKDINDDFEI
jgi:hypothetical protein